jgi:hypothetical protein
MQVEARPPKLSRFDGRVRKDAEYVPIGGSRGCVNLVLDLAATGVERFHFSNYGRDRLE